MKIKRANFVFILEVLASCELTPGNCSENCGRGIQTFRGECENIVRYFTISCKDFSGCKGRYIQYLSLYLVNVMCVHILVYADDLLVRLDVTGYKPHQQVFFIT